MVQLQHMPSLICTDFLSSLEGCFAANGLGKDLFQISTNYFLVAAWDGLG